MIEERGLTYDPYWRWSPQAACRGEETALFFPEGGSYIGDPNHEKRLKLKEEAKEALSICAVCPVLQKCRTQTLGEEYGIWGGMTERERRAARKQHQAVVATLPKRRKLRFGERIAQLYDRGVSWKEISRQFALTQAMCQELAELWKGHVRAQSEDPPPQMARTADRRKAIAWPKNPPGDQDAWIRVENFYHAATYVAQSPDGWLLMRYKHAHVATRVWLRPEDVKLTRNVSPVIQIRAGRRDYVGEKRAG